MIVVWILAGLVGLVVLAMLIGTFLPKHSIGSTTAHFARPAEEVWAALLDFRAHPMTGKMMKQVLDVEERDGLPTWVEDMGHGELIEVVTAEADTPHRMVRTMNSRGVPMTSEWSYVLEPTEQGCSLRIDGATTIPGGAWQAPIFRVMMTIGGGVKKGLDIQANMVAKTLKESAS